MKASSLKRLYGLGQTNFVVVDHEGFIRYKSRDNYDDQADIPAIRAAIVSALADLASSRSGAQASITALTGTARLPTRFALEQNFPNPFNAGTILRFSVGIEGLVSLQVFDVTGRPVRRLLDRRRVPPGAYDLAWDGRNQRGEDVASGFYIYRLATPDRVAARGMLLIR